MLTLQAALLGTDDAGRHGAGQPEGRTDGQDAVADLHLVAVAQLQKRQIALRL